MRERQRLAGSVTHLAGHLFNRGGAFQASDLYAAPFIPNI
jgi:hypothetical protein